MGLRRCLCVLAPAALSRVLYHPHGVDVSLFSPAAPGDGAGGEGTPAVAAGSALRPIRLLSVGKLSEERARELDKVDEEFWREVQQAELEYDRELAEGKDSDDAYEKYAERMEELDEKVGEKVKKIDENYHEGVWKRQ